jgi:16S rRNA U516 pseudouridylate synthase RsuA-like enzyme
MMILAESDSVGAIVGADNDASTSAISMAHHSHQHLKMYKPARVLSQFVFNHRKRRNRTLLREYVDVTAFDKNNKNIMAIGRLDEYSEGLLLLTTDGKVSEIVRRKTIEKEYWVQVSGLITEDALERLRGGVQICIPSPPPSSSSSLSSSFVEHGCDSNNRSIERGTGRIIYTTLPCRASKLETVIVECTMQQTSTLADGGDLTSDSHQRHSNHNISTKRNKRKFQGTCNTCGNTGHKALDCDQNPIIIDRGDERLDVRGPSIVALPPGISPPSRLPIREDDASSFRRHGPTSWISIIVTEGKYRQVRKMTAAVGYPTLRLVRVRIGSISLDGMKEGEVRMLHQTELDAINI